MNRFEQFSPVPEHIRAARETVRRIEFIDSAGLQLLADAHRRASLQGGSVTVRQPSAMVRRLLAATGLDGVLLIDRPEFAG